MSSQRQDHGSPKLKWQDEIDEVFGRANPNPTREGCPPREELIALSRRERPLSEPGWVHLTKCSPCYLEVRELHEQHKTEGRRRLLTIGVAAAAVVLALAAAAWFFVASRSGTSGLRAELDLRPYASMRGEPQEAGRQPLALPRGRVALTVLLPIGSAPGMYEVQVLDSDLRSMASTSGAAEIKNDVTALQTTLELNSLSAGAYQLAIRRTGQEWQLFPAQVR
jgi:hypothetical protein